MEQERHGGVVGSPDLPDEVTKAARTAVQGVLLARFPGELMRDAVKDEAPVRDAIGVTAGNGAEIRGMGDIVLDAIEAENDALRSL